jgi:hypothetical protein
MIHGQIISSLYTIVINLHTMAYKEGTKQKRERERGAQAIVTTLPQHCQEDHKTPMEGPSMIGTLKPGGFRSRGLPSHPSLGRCCTRTPVAQT